MNNNYGKGNRTEEILNLKPSIFMAYLEDIDEDDIKLFRDIQFDYSDMPVHISTSTVKNNTVRNEISRYSHYNGRMSTTFELKLIELGIVFANEEYYNTLAVGRPERNEGPLSNYAIAQAFYTSEDNVVMKKALDRAIKNFELNKQNNSVKSF